MKPQVIMAKMGRFDSKELQVDNAYFRAGFRPRQEGNPNRLAREGLFARTKEVSHEKGLDSRREATQR